MTRSCTGFSTPAAAPTDGGLLSSDSAENGFDTFGMPAAAAAANEASLLRDKSISCCSLFNAAAAAEEMPAPVAKMLMSGSNLGLFFEDDKSSTSP